MLYKSFGIDDSVFGMTDSQEWATQRNILGPFFSRRAILKLEGVIQAKVVLLP
jgi:cytochrome P450